MSPVTGLPEQATAYVAANKIIKKMKKINESCDWITRAGNRLRSGKQN